MRRQAVDFAGPFDQLGCFSLVDSTSEKRDADAPAVVIGRVITIGGFCAMEPG